MFIVFKANKQGLVSVTLNAGDLYSAHTDFLPRTKVMKCIVIIFYPTVGRRASSNRKIHVGNSNVWCFLDHD